MRLISKVASIVALSTVVGVATAASFPTNDFHVRGETGFGLRYINDQVMSKSDFGGAMELGLSAYRYNSDKSFYFGAQTFVNNAWDSRFNSVNNASDTSTATLVVHNSASLDFLAFAGKDLDANWRAEVGAGAQVSWVNWLASPQQAEDKLKVLPKLRVAISRKVSETASVFLAVNQAFNHYDSLRCSSGAANCFNDDGFVSVTDAKIGFTIQLS